MYIFIVYIMGIDCLHNKSWLHMFCKVIFDEYFIIICNIIINCTIHMYMYI